jgi:hypothetical protein
MPDPRAGVLGVPGIFMQSDLAWKCSYFIDLLVEAFRVFTGKAYSKRGQNQGFSSAVYVDEDLRFLPHC